LKNTFYSNGKLLITAEYAILDGVNALALPTKFGQSLSIEPIEKSAIIWKSFDVEGKVWLDVIIGLNEIISPVKNEHYNNKEITQLISILKEAKKLNPKFLNSNSGYRVSTKLEFPRNWGLGSSSTLINNIASWAEIDAFKLLKNTFGGSGYDIASAQNNSPIIYSNAGSKTYIEKIKLNWNFTDNIFFVHLNKKQNSRDAINNYNSQKDNSSGLLNSINRLTSKFIDCKNLLQFEDLIIKHEQIISEIIQQKPVKELLFNDYKGSIKSLGAWGGDFILATGDKDDWEYFRKKGFETILSFKEMIL
jgi:mevalonate kinase